MSSSWKTFCEWENYWAVPLYFCFAECSPIDCWPSKSRWWSYLLLAPALKIFAFPIYFHFSSRHNFVRSKIIEIILKLKLNIFCTLTLAKETLHSKLKQLLFSISWWEAFMPVYNLLNSLRRKSWWSGAQLAENLFFLASQDALEVMLVSQWVTDSKNRVDWCDPGKWRYLLMTLLRDSDN